MHFLSFYTVKTVDIKDGSLLDFLASLPISHVILPRAACFAPSRPANHAICSFIDSRGISIWANQKVFIYRLYNKQCYIPSRRYLMLKNKNKISQVLNSKPAVTFLVH